jgi:hypothetical protein
MQKSNTGPDRETPSEPTEQKRLRLTLDVDYVLNGESIENMTERLRHVAAHAIENGMVTGDSKAEIQDYATTVRTIPNPLSEGEVADFMLQRIESGALGLDDIPLRLARYGLMESHEFVSEMRERMENAATDA